MRKGQFSFRTQTSFLKRGKHENCTGTKKKGERLQNGETNMSVFFWDDFRLLTEIYEYSEAHAKRVLSGEVSCAFHAEKALDNFHKIRAILENVDACEFHDLSKEVEKVYEDLLAFEDIKELVRHSVDKGYIPFAYKTVRSFKSAIGIPPESSLEKGEKSLHRILASSRIFVCYLFLRRRLLEFVCCGYQISP